MRFFCNLLLVIVSIAIAPCALAVTADTKPLPTAAEVLQRVADKSRRESGNDEAFKDRYHFTRTKTTDYRNSSGELKKRESKTRVNKPDPAPVAVLPVSMVLPAKQAGDPNSTKFEKEDFLTNTNYLSRFKFTMVGREIVNGRPALVLDFAPLKKNLPEPSIKDKFINKAAGRVWVDEAEDVLVKADLRLTEKVNLIGGLVGSVSKANFSFIRSRTNEGLWFTHLLNWHVEAREVIFNRVIDFQETKTDVRKAW